MADAASDAYSGKGLVKEVISGDCLTILVSGGKAPVNEVVLTLASLDAPRLSRRNGDAPFARAAREFLRNKCAGQLVTFKVEYKVPTIGRTFGTVFVNGKDVSLAVVEAGFAAVKEARGGDCAEAYDELLALQERAKVAGAGMWTSDPAAVAAGSIKVRHAGDSDVSSAELASIFQQIEGKPVEAVIEYVRDGGSLRAHLVEHNIVVPFSLAGIAAPSFRGKGVRRPDGSYDDSNAKPEPFSALSKQFIETRLLSRRVNIRCGGGPPKVNTFFGKVEHPKGDISAELLKAGLARVSDWTLKYTPNRVALRAAEQLAKDQRRRIWKNYTPPDTSALAKFVGAVVEVNSADTITVEDSAGEEHRVSLSSIRVPFAGTRNGAKKPEPFSFEAREALRQLTIGKRVAVTVDYARRSRDRDGNERMDVAPRQSATVIVGKLNVAAELVQRGLATVIRHRADEPKSSAYDTLIDAEIRAEKGKLGVHGNRSKAARPPVDATRDAQKSKQFLSFLTRPGERLHQGVVEFCFNASKLKVHVPKENCLVAVSLIGVSTPRTGRAARNGQPAEPAEPYAEEALKFVKRHVLNRTVTIDIEDTDDRGSGSALATILVPIDGKKTNLNLELLKRGYGRVARWSADKSSKRGQLYDASDVARDARLGVWENFTPRSQTEEGEEAGGSTKVGTQKVRVSHIDDASSFYITVDDEEYTAALAELQELGPNLTAPEAGIKTKGNYAIDFDGEWCRVRVDKVLKEDAPASAEGEAETAEAGEAGEAGEADAGEAGEESAAGAKKKVAVSADISYLDFGNKETVAVGDLKELPPHLAKLSASATKAYLAFVSAPKLNRALGGEAGRVFDSLAWRRPLVAELLPADDTGVPVILYAADEDDSAEATVSADAESINEALVKSGLARVKRVRQRRGRPSSPMAPKGPHAPLQKTLQNLESLAHKAHVGIWRYGDPGDSDDE